MFELGQNIALFMGNNRMLLFSGKIDLSAYIFLLAISILNRIYNNAKGIQEAVLVVLANVMMRYWFFIAVFLCKKADF